MVISSEEYKKLRNFEMELGRLMTTHEIKYLSVDGDGDIFVKFAGINEALNLSVDNDRNTTPQSLLQGEYI